MADRAVGGRQPPKRGETLAVAAARVRADIAFAVVDVFVVVAAYTLGLALRMLDPLVGEAAEFWSDLALAMPVIVAVHLVANIAAGAYGHVWEHASTSEAVRVVVSNAAAGVLLTAGNIWARQTDLLLIPWSVPVTGGLVSLFAMGMVRFRSRLFSFHKSTGAVRLLVVGTGTDAVAFARQAPRLDGGRRVVGFLADEEVAPNGARRLAGLQILGSLGDIAGAVEKYDVDEVVVVGGDSTRTRQVVDLCLDVDVRLRMLPGARDVLRQGVAAVDVRDIEVEDLLVRQRVRTDLSSVVDLLRGKKILVTGAGGSIGSEIVQQVLGFDPAGVYALDRDETLLHDGTLRWPDSAHLVLGDVRDAERILRVFEAIRPDIVFHAAALKHVPVLEGHPEEAVLTNVIGTRNLIEAGSRTGMQRFVLISTDKAVSPVSVMGATKRVAELLTQAGVVRNDGCVYTAVRFGNVLGSRGSVVPTFVQQIKSGGPVTVTDPGMMRYFMTVDEAVQLVLQASALATGSEVFLLDMGEPVRIEDLARRLIRLSGMTPERDIEIRFTGRRPGEKLAEMLALDPLRPTVNEKIFEVRLDQPGAQALMDAIHELEGFASTGQRGKLFALIGDLVGGKMGQADSVTVIEEESPAAVSWS